MRCRSAILLLAISSALAAAPVPKEVKKEEKTEGTWQIESLVAFGRPANFGGIQYWTLDAEGYVTTHQTPAPPQIAAKHLQLAFEPKSKAVDYQYVNGFNGSYPGMYELGGDTLKVCCNLKGTGVRPTTVDAGPDVYLWTFKRVKAEAKK